MSAYSINKFGIGPKKDFDGNNTSHACFADFRYFRLDTAEIYYGEYTFLPWWKEHFKKVQELVPVFEYEILEDSIKVYEIYDGPYKRLREGYIGIVRISLTKEFKKPRNLLYMILVLLRAAEEDHNAYTLGEEYDFLPVINSSPYDECVCEFSLTEEDVSLLSEGLDDYYGVLSQSAIWEYLTEENSVL